jgi:ribonuclease P protein component
MSFSFTRSEKLKSKKAIESMFAEGQSISAYPLRLVFQKIPNVSSNKVAVSVTKKKFKTAVARNRIKRLLRENYRLNKTVYFNNITTHYALMILYIGTNKPTFKEIEATMNILFKKFRNKVSP